MSPHRAGWLAAMMAALGFYAVAEALDVRPGRPMAMRTDLFFQSDAGGIVQDAVTNNNERARGVHSIIYPLWTRPLHALCAVLSPDVAPEVAATYGSRVLVNLGSGAGLGVLVAVMRRRGVSLCSLSLFLIVMVVAGGNTLAAIPDHFGLSLGALTASFAIFIAPGSPKNRALGLILCTGICGAITITNVLFPLLLLVVLAWRELAIPRRVWLAAGLTLFMGIGAMAAMIASRPDLQQRIDERIGLYLTWTLTRDPPRAATMAARAAIDSVVPPSPAIDTNNLDRVPMLTYQARGTPYLLWPYDAWQSAGMLAWLALLVPGTLRAWKTHRPAAIVLLVWFAWNVLFHLVWGDEFFLYSPHYAWALVTLAFLDANAKWIWLRALPVFVIVVVNVRTLGTFREKLAAIPF